MSVKGKGLTAEEFEIFNKNEKIFNNNFGAYIKSLSSAREREFAQLRRKYQSTFEEQEEFTAIFTHKLTNPDEFCENLCRAVKKSGIIQLFVRIPEDFEQSGCDIVLLNGEFPDEFKEGFENELKKHSVNFRSLFQGLKYVDSHIQKISAEVYASVKEQKTEERRTKMEKLLELSKKNKKNLVELPKVEVVEETKTEVLPAPQKEESPKDPEFQHSEEHKELNTSPDHSKPNRHPEKLIHSMTIPKQNLSISARQLTFRNLGSAYFTTLNLELCCTRCSTRHYLKSSLSEAGLQTGDNYFEDILTCSCTFPLSFKVTSCMIFQKSGKKMAEGRFSGCSILDIPEFDMKFTCPDCGEFSSLFSARSYTPYIVTCQSCFSKGTFQTDGFEFLDTVIKPEDQKNAVGKPLPKNGVCKHFKSSFRWFKFPCCQRLFPCMICHDDNTDHPSQRSELYVCGFCGVLQKCSNRNLCKKCGGCINGQDSDKRFWEGGKGCRNNERLSKNDKRKFKNKK